MADIFISFIHEEVELAEAVKSFLLEKLEIPSSVFLASEMWAIYAGENLLDRIKEELASAKISLLMMSKGAVGRPWVNFEAGAAWLTGKVMIPVCFGALELGNLPKPYSSLQSVSLDEGYGPYYLDNSIHHYLDSKSLGPVPFTPRDTAVEKLRSVLKLLNVT